jgi:hypothetical protein
MNTVHKFAPFATRPNLNPKLFDPGQQTFVPDRSLDTDKVREISVRKIHMLGAKVYNSATQSIPSNSTWHDVTFDTKTFDEGDLWRVSDPTKLTVPYAGIWTVSAFISYAADPTDYRHMQILAGATTLIRTVTNAINGFQTDLFLSADFKFVAGRVLTVQTRQVSGGALNIQDGEDDNFFSAVYRGPV